ncbi:hypothetical protein CQW23_06301 [Capsicum baccatum]|uniref:Zinc finger protein CONSTANS-LIKE 9 n=1 Tax=Capsicum baccatum TaxID=33114 RepID=A0A2G2X327_CAPBA|nr:hypothetical protein CQW23_06301 [Capsicum baccatum]
MGYICEYCGEQRSIVYCRSDAACLCLSCDRNVHSANALSQRHSRTLICERCNSQPAVVRCIEERTSLCQNCDWSGHASSSSGSTMHKRQALSSYTGCPSAAELSNIWSFLLDDPSVGDTCEQRMGSMSINDNRPRDGQDPQGKDNSQNVFAAVEVSEMNISDKSNLLMESSMPTFDNKLPNLEPPIGSSSKGFYMGAKGSSLFEEDPYCDNLIMDSVDMGIQNYEELFGDSLNYPDELFENENFDCFFEMKDVKGTDSSCQDIPNAAEGSAIARVNTVHPTCSDAASADSVMSCKTDSILYFARQSSLSVSKKTGECSTGDYQDCGVSPMLLMGEPPPWCPPGPEISSPSTSRSNAVLRYKEKKKTRKFDKRVRYVSRKARADVRRRVKGRFIKAGDAYDYDPLPTRSY